LQSPEREKAMNRRHSNKRGIVRDRGAAEDNAAFSFKYSEDARRTLNVDIGQDNFFALTSKQLAAKAIVMFFVILLMSCSSGPTDENVWEAMEFPFEAIDLLPMDFDESVMNKFNYRDDVAISNYNDDYTLNQDIKFTLNRNNGRMDLEVVLTYDGYVEPKSGNALYGTTVITGFGNVYKNTFSEDDVIIKCDLNYSAGKVETLSFTLDRDAILKQEIADLLVNGAPYAFTDRSGYSSFLKQAISNMRLSH
jgi:hypothetical protein